VTLIATTVTWLDDQGAIRSMYAFITIQKF